MPVPTKLDPVAFPEKGRNVEGPLLCPVTFNRTLSLARFKSVRANQFSKAGSAIKECWKLRLIRLGRSNPLLKAFGNIYFHETHVIRLYIFDKLIFRVT